MPRLYLSHAGAATLARVRADVPADLAAELLQRAAREPRRSVADAGWPAGAQRYRDLLAASAPVSWEARGPIYRAAHTLAAPPGVVAINAGNAELLRPLLPQWLPDVPHRWPFVAVVADGAAVSVCASSRITPAAHAAGVETHPDWRRRGCGRRAVAGWVAAVQRAGALALYSTGWSNVGSQQLAASLGLARAGAEFQLG